MTKIREWLEWHSIRAHIVAPIWLRVSEKRRWTIVHWLNKSRRFCWSDLVGAAYTHREDDACDIRTPLGAHERRLRCATVCDWLSSAGDHGHMGEHACSCYCGKFQFTASEGSLERTARQEATP